MPWEHEVVSRLLEWWRAERRSFPWREARSPWLVLLAGVLLRKTGAKAVARVYPRLAEKYSKPERVLSSGVGELEEDLRFLGMYRRRARELVELARVLCSRYGGRVPRSREELVKLPGVGDYIASVVLCYAFGESTPTIDTNTGRLVSRLAGVGHSEVREVYE
ncbi:MAG: A/G-specific adenine glycosylase, partial [Thermoproteota archaeon]